MERLKAILADKILDLSTTSGDEVKAKVDKIQRFRDFANACRTLMIKYPAIEDELINMVEDGDFDTKVASSRVDTVIRLADAEATQARNVISQVEEPIVSIAEENEISDIPAITEPEEPEEIEYPDSEEIPHIDDIPMEVYQGEEEPLYQPEDIDYEELQFSPEEEAEKGYVTYEDVKNEEIPEFSDIEEYAEVDLGTDIETVPEKEAIEHVSNVFPDEEELERAARRKVTIRRVVQAISAILIIVALIFVVKFVMIHWQIILIVAGILIVLAILIVWMKRKRS